MSLKCDHCNKLIFNMRYIECTKESCKKCFHLVCMALPLQMFECYKEDYKTQWLCPECTYSKSNETLTPACSITGKVNIIRGNSSQVDLSDCNILEVFCAFEEELRVRLDNQMESSRQLDSEMDELREQIRVMQEKKDSLDDKK